MKVLVIGSGGREHALVWKLAQSSLVSKVWCLPGNGGISQQAECVAGNLADIPGLADLAQNFLNRHGIPTARSYGAFDSVNEANAVIAKLSYPVVVKADGLCAGKGVLVAKSYGEAAEFTDRVLEKKECGSFADKLLIEEALEGEELSFIVLCDGGDFVPLVATRD